MADPNRKINLDLASDDSDERELDPSEISLVKEFEAKFKNRFTEDDKVFTEFCKQKPKPPPIVFPFEAFHNHRGGHRGGGGGGHRGGRFQHYGNRQNFDNQRNNYDGPRYNNNYNKNRDQQQPFKKRRDDSNQSKDSNCE